MKSQPSMISSGSLVASISMFSSVLHLNIFGVRPLCIRVQVPGTIPGCLKGKKKGIFILLKKNKVQLQAWLDPGAETRSWHIGRT